MSETGTHPDVVGDGMDYEHAFAEENLPALALGALEEEEGARVREHMRQCPYCRAEYFSFESVAAALAHAVPQVDPPPHLRHVIRTLTAPTSAKPARPFDFLPGKLALPRARQATRLLMATLFLITLGLLGWNVSLHQRMTVLAQEATNTREVGAILMDYMEHPDAYVYLTMIGKAASRAPRGMVLMARTNNRLLLVVEGLPVEAGAVYTVWLIDRQGRRLHARKVRCDGQGRVVLLLSPPVSLKAIWRIQITPAEEHTTPLLEGELPENHGHPLFMVSAAL